MGFGLDLGALVVNLRMDTAQFDKQAKSLSPKLKNIGSQATALGRSISLRVTAPIVALGTASVFAFAQFDQAITKSTAIMSGVTAELRREMERTALTISSQSTTSAKNLADAYFFLASAGLSAKQSIAALDTVNTFAVAGQFDMALATDLLTDAQTALGLSSKDAAENQKELLRISDVLVKANTIANASVQQFAESLTADAATAAKNFGSSLETTVAVLAAYASAGKKGAEAGNLFGRATRLLTKAQRDNGAVFEKFGIDVIDKATGKYNNLIDILAQMEDAFKDLTKPQRDAALEQLGFAALAQKSITPLLGLSDAMKEYERSVLNASGVTKEITEKQLKSFNSQIKILFNQVTNAAIQIGKVLAPAILFVNVIIKKGLELWGALPSFIKTTVIVIAGLVAAIGPLLIAFGSLLGLIAIIIPALPALAIAFEAVTIVVAAGVALVTVGFGTLMAAILPIVGVILIVIAAWDSLVEIFDKVMEAINEVVSFITTAFMPVWEELVNLVDEVMEAFGAIVDLIGSILSPILTALWEILKVLLIPVFVQMKVVIFVVVAALRIIVGVLRVIVLVIKKVVEGWQLMVDWLGVLREKLVSSAGDFAEWAKSAGASVLDFAKDKLGAVSDKIKDMTGGLIDFAETFKVIGKFIQDNFIDPFLDGIESLLKGFENLRNFLGLDPKLKNQKEAEKVRKNRERLDELSQQKLDQRDDFLSTAKLARKQGNIKVAEDAERKAEEAQQAFNALRRASATGEFKLIDLSDPDKKKKKKTTLPEDQLKGVEKTLKDILDKSKKEFEQNKPKIQEKKVEQEAFKTQTKFQEINLARIGIGGAPTTIKEQTVKAKGVEAKLDKTNELLEQMGVKGSPAVLAP